jgi:hypothetical protein
MQPTLPSSAAASTQGLPQPDKDAQQVRTKYSGITAATLLSFTHTMTWRALHPRCGLPQRVGERLWGQVQRARCGRDEVQYDIDPETEGTLVSKNDTRIVRVPAASARAMLAPRDIPAVASRYMSCCPTRTSPMAAVVAVRWTPRGLVCV